ncbi:family 16 glycosylhydrolase [Enterococcus sp. RIT-PI-f]|uniref:family 16 glycosylhydrolase n=1 Tax=Enterococcus sp. RIT-PI-f TaxID=1690244 RepID=UPI003564AFD5
MQHIFGENGRLLKKCKYLSLFLSVACISSYTQVASATEDDKPVSINQVSNNEFNDNYVSNKTNWEMKSGDYAKIETDSETGKSYGIIKPGSNDEFILQKISTVAGKTYRISAQVCVESTNNVDGVFLTAKNVTENGGQGDVLGQLKFTKETNGWETKTFEFTAVSNKTMIGIVKWAENNQAASDTEIRITDVSVTEQLNYDLIWSDEFTEDSLDQSIWGYELGSIRGNEQQHYTSSQDNVFMKDGNLVLKVTDRKKEDQYVNPRGGSSARSVIYNSGSVRTHGKKEFLYGRIEARAKLPKGKGAFPAFWTLGSEFILDGDVHASQGYGWPTTGEIDIMELIGGPTETREPEESAEGNQSNKIAYGTPHFYYDKGDSDKDGSYSPYELGGNLALNKDFYDDYHIFGINWTPEKIEWYVDGIVYNSMELNGEDRLEAAAASLNRPQYIQFNLATGGNWAKNAGNYLAEDNTEFLVDYVRYYQSKEQQSASIAYYKNQPKFSGVKDIVMAEGEEIDLLNGVSVDTADYQINYSIDDEYMFENSGGNTNVTLKNSGDKKALSKLKSGIYNIHYSALPKGLDPAGHQTATHKIARVTKTLVVLPKGGLGGKEGEKLKTVNLPYGWSWQDEEQTIQKNEDYIFNFKQLVNTGTESGKERNVKIHLSGEDITKTVEIPEEKKVFIKEENITLDGSKEMAINESEELQKNIEKIMNMKSGTLTFNYRFDNEDSTVRSNIMSFLSISNKDTGLEYASFYIKPKTNKIGVEFRGANKAIEVGSGFNLISNSDWQTVSYVFDGSEMTVYLNGEVFGSAKFSDLFSDIPWKDKANTVLLGGVRRLFNTPDSFLWNFKGLMSSVIIDENVLSEQDVKKLHQSTQRDSVGEKIALWDKYSEDIFEYRIPSIVKTKKGTLIAASDGRKKHYNDWGDIATVIRTSNDDGKTWSENNVVLDLATQPYFTKDYLTTDWNTNHTQSAFSIDPTLGTDSSGRIYLLVDVMPESQGAIQTTLGTGHKEVNGKKYLILNDFRGNEYTVREGGIVYTSDNKKTNYYVDSGEFKTAFKTKGDLYEKVDGQKAQRLGNIYLRSGRNATGITKEGSDTAPLFTKMTNFLWIMTSEDEGKTWSSPVDITPDVKEEWMGFLGTGAAPGIEIDAINKEGKRVKRMTFPIYYTNPNGAVLNKSLGKQSSANIYSDDGGKTWQRGESPNDGRTYDDGKKINSKDLNGETTELTENQIVQLNNGHLLQFMRNTGKTVAIARSTDYGLTWDDEVLETDIPEPYVNLSAIHINQNDKEYIILSNPLGHPTGEAIQVRNSRSKGVLRIGEVQKDDSIKWLATKIIEPKRFAYSSLVQLTKDNIGMAYEYDGHIKYSTFNVTEMIEKEERFDVANITNITAILENPVLKSGDEIEINIQFNQNMFVIGERSLDVQIGGRSRKAKYKSGSGTNCLTFTYEIIEEDKGTIETKGIMENTKVETMYGYSLENSEKNYELASVGEGEENFGLDVKAIEILKKGEVLQTNPSGISSVSQISWNISNEKIASVDKNGCITGLKVGTTEITAKIGNGDEVKFVLRVTN